MEFGYLLGFFAGWAGGHSIGVFAHELGHVIAALLLGRRILKVSFGGGRRLREFSFGRTRVEWRAWPFSGSVQILPPERENIWATRFFLLGGVTVNLILLIVALYLIWHPSLLVRWVALGVALSQTYLLAGNLLPGTYQEGSATYRSDGMQLLSSDLGAAFRQQAFRDAALKPYTVLARDEAPASPLNPRLLQHVTSTFGTPPEKQGSAHHAFLRRESEAGNLSTAEELYLIDATITSWLKHNPQEHIGEMEQLIDRAMEIGGDVKAIRQTRGAVLVELGRFAEAKEQILAARTDSDAHHELALNAYFLARAHLGLGEIDDASREADAMRKFLMALSAGPEVDKMLKSLQQSISEQMAQ